MNRHSRRGKASSFRWAALGLATLVSLASGCGSKDETPEPPGRGSAACNEWQRALCGWAQGCGAAADVVAECKRQVRGINCKSDELASNCATALSGGACTATTAAGCDIRDLADPVPAQAACSELVGSLCDAFERCGQQDKASCVAEQGPALCDNALGVGLSLDSCQSELRTLACSAASLPNSCEDLVLQDQG
jgi:hypothetical protein